MAEVNPYHIINKMNADVSKLKNGLDAVEENISLDRTEVRDGREEITDAYLDNRLRADKPITFLGFIDDFRKLWEAAGKKGKITRKAPLKEEADFPVISYRLIRRIVNSSFKDIKPRYRTTIRHPYMNNEYVDIYGQVFDLWVEFNVYSQSAEEADQLVMELEEFLQTYAGFFKSKGVQEILFHSQGEDEVIQKGRVSIAKRKISYTMRFEKINVQFLNEIEQIGIQAQLLNNEKSNN